MRVKLGYRIYDECTVATHRDDSEWLLLTISNEVYTVKMNSIEEANKSHQELLTNGFYDFSNNEYSN